MRLVAIRKIVTKRRQNAFTQLYRIVVAGGARAIERFAGRAGSTCEVSRLGVSRSQGVQKSRNFALGQIAGMLGQANCLGPIARVWIWIRCKKPGQLVQQSWRVRGGRGDFTESL